MPEIRAYGSVLPVPSTATLTLTVVLTDGVTPITINASDAAFATITGSSSVLYRTEDYAQQLASKLNTWITAAIAADAAVTTKGTASVTLTFAPAITRGGSLFSLALSIVGAQSAGGPLTIQSATLDNATGAYSPLGLVYETATGTTTRTGTLSGGNTVATWAGLWQARSLFLFERSEADEGDAEGVGGSYHAHLLGDGAVRTFETGYARTIRTIRILDLSEGMSGRPEVLGRLASSSALSSDRVTLSLQTAATTTLSGISSLYYNSDAATAGYFVRVPATPRPWFARLKTGASSSAVTLVEKVPTGYTVTPSAPLMVVSEAHALWAEVKRLGLMTIHPVNDSTGAVKWVSEEYALAGDSAPRYMGERHSAGAPIYSYSFSLLKSEKPGLTLAS